MADTKHSHLGEIPVEGDGISYRGISWFVGVLVLTTVASQGLMLGLFKYLEHDVAKNGVARNPLAGPVGQLPPAPNLLTDEPANLRTFREAEEHKLSSYGWIDKNAGTVRLPIDRAKELLLERGLPTGAPPAAAAPAAPKRAGESAPPTKIKSIHHEDHEDF